ncbi:DUF5068 domain-containing protein [Domibacillus sp. PGB-M46]|uniref:DUF5068 domain-containing protein n=1 Tax=Domibacillus sp. PGB-M46 TaxID=2910255 RepID=UPI001F57FDA2|nr:DUF5068 domain-containing protein [Domibacillus sp. PGB-M46]MCI2256987.1 DUF5068 domain-containing protein [Domibacillus sp. PGB-M46]
MSEPGVKDDPKPKTEEAKAVSAKEETSSAEEKSTSESSEILNPKIAAETEGNVEVVYTNKEPKFTHDMNGFKVLVDEYPIVKVTDMNEDSMIPFNDQINGYVVSAKAAIGNGTSKPMYYNN